MVRRLLLLAVLGFASPAYALNELVLGMSTAPGSLNPITSAMMATSFINGMRLRFVTAYDANWQRVCLLCTELPTFENGRARIVDLPPDEKGNPRKGVETDFELKPMVWGDGTPLTVRDIQFTIAVGQNPKSGVPSSEEYRRIIKFEAKDDRHFTLTRDRITYDYNALDLTPLPAHLEKPIFDADPADYRNKTLYDSEPTNPGLGFGPYRFVELIPGNRIALEPNPHWTGPAPAFRRILVKIFENSASLEANLVSGNVDYIPGESGLSLNQALALQKLHGERFDFVFKPSLTYAHIDVKLDNPLLADIRVRRALLMAIDRQGISDRLFQGKQPVADGDVNPLDPMWSPVARRYAYDPEGAKKLLDEAGFSDIRNGIRHNAKGEKLSIVLDFASGNRMNDLLSQVIQSQLRQVGIELRLKAAPARIYFAQLVKRNFEGLAFYSWVTSPQSVPRTTLYSTEIPTKENGWSGQNYPGYARKAMDEALDGAERELDPAKRRSYFADILRLYSEDLPVLPMYFRVDSFIIPKRLKGLVPTGTQYSSTLWIETWKWEDK